VSIITPKDVITITIDNTQSPPRIDMKASRTFPAPYLTMVLCHLAVQMNGDLLQRMQTPLVDQSKDPEIKGKDNA